MYESKTRALPVNLGEAGNGLYFASSGIWYSADFKVATRKQYLDLYNRGKLQASTNSIIPSNIGSEFLNGCSNGRAQYNPVEHCKVYGLNLPFGYVVEAYGWPSMCYYAEYQRNNDGAQVPYLLKDMVHPGVDYQAARARAWHNMQPRFEGEVDMANFLFELKDFRDVSKALINHELSLYKLRKIFNKMRKQKHRPTDPLFDPTPALARGVLLNNLMLQPLIKDIASILNQITIIVSEAQSQFRDAGVNSYQTSHYSEEIYRDDRLSPGSYNNAWVASGELRTTKFTATLKYKYDYTMRDTVNAWLVYWGLNGSWESLWNCLPFSFLVDYVVQIGNSLRAMEHDNHVRLLDYVYGESLKTSFMRGIVTTDYPSTYAVIINGQEYVRILGDRIRDRQLSGQAGSCYSRLPRTPYYGPATPKLKLPSGKQGLNMAALLRCFL